MIRVVTVYICPGAPIIEGIPNADAEATNTRSPAAIILGVIIGMVMVISVLIGEAPDILEASSNDGSIFSIALDIVINA